MGMIYSNQIAPYLSTLPGYILTLPLSYVILPEEKIRFAKATIEDPQFQPEIGPYDTQFLVVGCQRRVFGVLATLEQYEVQSCSLLSIHIFPAPPGLSVDQAVRAGWKARYQCRTAMATI